MLNVNNIFASAISLIFAVNAADLKNAGIIFGYGMLAIFTVILLIISVTYLINYTALKLKDRKSRNANGGNAKQ
ncbi:MAG: hypothetical protein LBP79_07000 [Clostridiales bacterium]|jgi:predicted Na+-dependent transporter|nr:hypothetical protein [Clostridiales bacterium]